ncbi:oligopeptide ABC transporter substrate-binding protein [Ligilactobacillus salitolerans]|uniref:Oligopeptide ABC transporter substrate-binding protein n=1 Tax=Ligilactobacillus salitolerans TaxID=1808352 RepID=A0A401ITF6_9LACO|nr:peptide ABC transporter substrate-binding protein [Ligilactobacillus salitolerans]GBG94821.1 oligopeptide ABC transporter substrate-binding protein [Ligilactobacillus salitolerans]
MGKKIWYTFAAGAALLLAGCGNQKNSQDPGHSGKYAAKQELRWTEASTLATADLSKATDTLSFNTLMNTQEGLYRLDKNGKPQPALAVKTKKSNGVKTYDFTLRKNAKWSNGDPVTAKDFVYSWRRTVDPKTASQDAFYFDGVKNATAIYNGKQAPQTLGIKAVDDHHLRVELAKPVSYFDQLLAWPLFYPLNQKVVEKYGSKYGTQSKYLVSNGAFKLTKWDGTGKSWTLAKNKTYWDQKHVHLDKISELVTESTTTSYNMYSAKKVDETLLNGQQVKANKNSAAFVKRLPTATTRLELNQKKVPAFKNKKIRQAISLAIDRKQLTDKVLQDGSEPLKGFVPSQMGQNPKTGEAFEKEAYVKSAVTANVKKAKTLLKEGYSEEGINSLHVNLLTSDTDSSKQTAEFLQSKLESLPGVRVTVSTIPFVQMLARQTKSDYDMTIKTWQSVFADPINFLDVYEADSSYNTAGYKNTEFDKLLDQSENQYGNQPAKRWQNLVQAEKILMNDQGTIPLYQVAKSQLLRPNVKNVIYNPAGVPYDWKEAYISADK